ncbi:hypothetical protein N5079_19840 [Planotetraspora sp. A-T 1434]|uniref:hypothetical protein n=1 Tax=Planotetraspora sp. A-T 1434 TaxID=2979219 RepID=UPI0021C12EFF|nr:hypothetical protein [Planotetraspora sp. A-T 1434]MCT9932457.1 hypothetical protein [Planotetraspora sp. A-T 1434]
MATLPNPRTWTVGELLTGAKLNAELRDNLNFLLSPPTALLWASADQSLTHATWGAISWASEQYDNDGGHSNSTNPSRFTAQTAGWYKLITTGSFNSSTSGTLRGLKFRKNGTTDYGELLDGMASNGVASLITSAVVQLAVNDYVEVLAYQDTGGSLTWNRTIDTTVNYFYIRWMNP